MLMLLLLAFDDELLVGPWLFLHPGGLFPMRAGRDVPIEGTQSLLVMP